MKWRGRGEGISKLFLTPLTATSTDQDAENIYHLDLGGPLHYAKNESLLLLYSQKDRKLFEVHRIIIVSVLKPFLFQFRFPLPAQLLRTPPSDFPKPQAWSPFTPALGSLGGRFQKAPLLGIQLWEFNSEPIANSRSSFHRPPRDSSSTGNVLCDQSSQLEKEFGSSRRQTNQFDATIKRPTTFLAFPCTTQKHQNAN